MKISYFHVNVFTNQPFQGNAAIVCQLESWLDDDTLLKLAQEFNQPITAFIVPKPNGDVERRWFTIKQEMAVCGHGAMAVKFVMSNFLNQPISIELARSELTHAAMPDNITKMLGVKPIHYMKSQDRYIAVFDNEKQIVNLHPNFELLKTLDLHSFVVTAKGREHDFVSRSFGPKVGINEDAVTGSSHAAIAPYWSEQLNKKTLTARQLSHRPGNVLCEIKDDMIQLTGQCYLFAKGELEI